MDFDILWLRFLGDENIGEDDSNDEDDDDDNHTLPHPSFRMPKPCDTTVLHFLRTCRRTSVMMMRHGLFQNVVK